ncbi:TylF/MycF/NovP-related O-methyltransferase [Desulfovibrio intestinalis]|uniref:Putative O-methyltransferase YrrM n=1 Tax=Desulfovibrio intestinalis TaxID=58621 RepID=A0A7W8C1H0_9BACT|nr:TylF/MycF/NovP-related O-methyltransferase [Desulfovibrio intestinalis]MBB5143551.1 putative O-methyltransferase YrrM [Desulfovibrio intestinalis]
MTKLAEMSDSEAKELLLASATGVGKLVPDMAGVLADGSGDGMMFKQVQGPFPKGPCRFALYGHADSYVGAFYELIDSAQQCILFRGRVATVEKNLLAVACLDLQRDSQSVEIRVYVRQGTRLLVTRCMLRPCSPFDVKIKDESDNFLYNIFDSDTLLRLPLPGARKGVSLHDGAARGISLQQDKLRAFCEADPLFHGAQRAAHGLSLVTRERFLNMFILLKYYLPKLDAQGDIIEFGTFRGGMALFMAYLLKFTKSRRRVYALDTFEGMPLTESAQDYHKQGDFKEDNLMGEMLRRKEMLGLDNLILVKGLFENTVPTLFQEKLSFALAHIDCDIYDAVAYSYESVKDRMVAGGYVVFDDPLAASCQGAMAAVEELLYHRDKLHAEQVYPHMVFRLGLEQGF